MHKYELVITFRDETSYDWEGEAASIVHALNAALGQISQADAENILHIEVA
jgi:hypothetical protein